MMKRAPANRRSGSPLLSHEKYDRFMDRNYDECSNFFVRWIMCNDLMKRIRAIAESWTAGKDGKTKDDRRVALQADASTRNAALFGRAGVNQTEGAVIARLTHDIELLPAASHSRLLRA
jgi:hypothetical protein